jgi:SfnB family sulfur acquisition oxidoreductase
MSGIQRRIRNADALPRFELNPEAHRIGSDVEALAVARQLAGEFATDAAERDREQRLPVEQLDRFSGSGLWAITVPKAYGGANVSISTLAEVIATISAADPSLGQLPQNHFAALDVIRVTASEEQKRLWFGRALQGCRLGNAFPEATSEHVGAVETKRRPVSGAYVVNSEKLYATGALFADFIHIAASDEKGNIILAIVPRGSPGLTIVDNSSSFGQRTIVSGNVLIDNVHVGPEAVIPAYLGAERPSSNGSVSQIIPAAVDAGIARAAIEETMVFVRKQVSPWIDGGQQHGHEDVFTIAQIGDLEVKLHAAEAMLARAGRAIDGIRNNPSDEAVSEVAVKVAEAKVLTTEIALLATSKLHELCGARSTFGEFSFDQHWRDGRTHTLHDPVRWKYFHVGNHLLNGIGPPRHASS